MVVSALNELALTLVASVPNVDMKTAGVTSLYTVPTGKTFYPFAIIVRNPSASLARAGGATEYDFGTGANCDTWKQDVSLVTMTTPNTDYWIIAATTKFTNCVAASVFGVKVITGCDAVCTATIDVIGYLV